ncbi:unnamed protein product [Spodoptera exigua]|nr:unnamed protein product [Spodoptera exigua]
MGGGCISVSQYCDGKLDCDDGSDENFCIEHKPFQEFCNETHQYMCQDSTKCVPLSWLCNGETDCDDGSDEFNCTAMPAVNGNSTCKGFQCGDGKCISFLWVCDGVYDCPDKSDEYAEELCRHVSRPHAILDGSYCQELHTMDDRNYKCLDASFCLPSSMMCDGLQDCRDGSDEGPFCKNCPEAMLFFNTRNDIRYLKIKTKEMVTVATDIKEGHGVSFDGTYIYWVETAQGHQSIFKAQLGDVKDTKEVLVGLGLEDPGDIAVDYLGGNIYFSDAERGTISACRVDGSICTTIKTDTKNPRFVTLDPKNGKMYWADWHERPVIMTARMDGSRHDVLVDSLENFATGLAVDAPNGRLYFVDKTVKVVMITAKHVYPLFEEPFHHPYSIAVFENTVFWSDWTSNSIQTTDKLHGTAQKRNVLLKLDTPVLDSLFIYDGQRRTINYINMSDFTLGVTHVLIYNGLENVVDMDYDYVTDNLYVLDASRRVVEAVSLRTQKRAIVHRFEIQEMPISFCLLSDYGRMLVAVVESEMHNTIHVDSIGLDGSQRRHVIMNNLKGPHVRLRYVPEREQVFISDESNGIIDYIHPEGTGRENYRELTSTVTSLAIADNYVFWTDRKTPRLFWSDIHEASPKIRRIDLALFPNTTQLLIQATNSLPDPKDPLLNHPCLKNPCSDVCVQLPHDTPQDHPKIANFEMGYKCLCPPGLLVDGNQCIKPVTCGSDEILCHKSNVCVKQDARCDGKADCPKKEDEEGCIVDPANICSTDEIFCNGLCINKDKATMCSSAEKPNRGVPTSANELTHYLTVSKQAPTMVIRNTRGPEKLPSSACSSTEFQCTDSSICISRSQLCDQHVDCPNGSDEQLSECDTYSCHETEFMCASGSCIVKTWTCDGDRDCNDGSDEINCGFYQCRNRECVELSKRCDGHRDCTDYSDEEDCDEPQIIETVEAPKCAAWEYTCEKNTSICLPQTARCNMKTDCPGGTDEHGCDLRCAPKGMFACGQQVTCITMNKVCNGHLDCGDGSDETPDACSRVNRTSHLFPVARTLSECTEGYKCNNGQCIEWSQVCDKKRDCIDGTDENGVCETACANNTCTFTCQPTPFGRRCLCPFGFQPSKDQFSCEDIDECTEDVCSQGCINVPGSFLCWCHHGYAIRRSDRRSCKAIRGNMSILYVSGNSVRSISADGYGAIEYTDTEISTITDMDYNVRQKKLYVASEEGGKLLEVNETQNVIAVTNVGKPSRVAVDWVTGNVYFVDTTPLDKRIRVCHVKRKRCASLIKLPSDATVTAFIVEPSSSRMFYCITRKLESVIWTANLAGRHVTDLATVRNCTGLAADSFKQKLYVAETGPAHIIRMDYEGENFNKILSDHPRLQAPHGLEIFEDYIYYLEANSFRLSRCQLYGSKHCETYVYRVFDANTFVIRHESIQRDDLLNDCDDVVCDNICAMDEDGPKCLCNDGALAKGGKCPEVDKKLVPLFNGWSYEELASAHSVSFTIIIGVLILIAIYLGVFVYYHFVYLPRKRMLATPYTEVRFQNTHNSPYPESDPTVELHPSSSVSHEFINPLQYVRNMWYGPFKKDRRPNNISGLPVTTAASPPQPDFSDTESDLDDKETLHARTAGGPLDDNSMLERLPCVANAQLDARVPIGPLAALVPIINRLPMYSKIREPSDVHSLTLGVLVDRRMNGDNATSTRGLPVDNE